MWFSPELRTASVIPRWSVVWTLTRDVLSNHSFFVANYAYQIAALIGWEGSRSDLLLYALLHDTDETITGDLVAPAKREILDTDRAQNYIERKMKERLPFEQQELEAIRNGPYGEDVKLIVKAADRLDAVIFLVVEQRLGNSVISPRIPEALHSLKEAWHKLPVSTSSRYTFLEHLYVSTVYPAIEKHRTTGGYGI